MLAVLVDVLRLPQHVIQDGPAAIAMALQVAVCCRELQPPTPLVSNQFNKGLLTLRAGGLTHAS